jgi:hypothetical protein
VWVCLCVCVRVVCICACVCVCVWVCECWCVRKEVWYIGKVWLANCSCYQVIYTVSRRYRDDGPSRVCWGGGGERNKLSHSEVPGCWEAAEVETKTALGASLSCMNA